MQIPGEPSLLAEDNEADGAANREHKEIDIRDAVPRSLAGVGMRESLEVWTLEIKD